MDSQWLKASYDSEEDWPDCADVQAGQSLRCTHVILLVLLCPGSINSWGSKQIEIACCRITIEIVSSSFTFQTRIWINIVMQNSILCDENADFAAETIAVSEIRKVLILLISMP